MQPGTTTAPTTNELARYRPISDYGVIGDCRTAALVAPDGAIDWCCLPHFDSPAVLCRLLDAERGGYMKVSPSEPSQGMMAYIDGTNILQTIFTSAVGKLEVLDFMPIRQRRLTPDPSPTPIQRLTQFFHDVPQALNGEIERRSGNDVAAAHRINRIVTALDSDMTVELTLKATFDYARATPNIARHDANAQMACATLSTTGHILVLVVKRLSGKQTETIVLGGDDAVLSTRIALRKGERVAILLNYARDAQEAESLRHRLVTQDIDNDYAETLHYWREWSAKCRYTGPYRDVVLRSALVLKLCTFEPTGAIIAAPTTSLPEMPQGVRNWDYRFTWLRDSAFTLDALGSLGYMDEARDYFHFLHDLHLQGGADLRIMYSIHGASGDALAEQTLDHLSGYQGARPVRIGNGAANQKQMDVYGEVLDVAHRYYEQSGYRSYHRLGESNRTLHSLIIQIADYVAEHWQDTDQGLWEVRGPARPFVYSRVMCWIALERACEKADSHSYGVHEPRWAAARDAIRADILAHGYNERLQSFVQYYDSDVLDASNLRLAICGFLAEDDPMMVGTINATKQHLAGDNGLIYRYKSVALPGQLPQSAETGTTDDGLPGMEGAFTVCTFWLIQNLCAIGRIDEAQERFEALLGYASPLGLLAEELDPKTGMQLGNFPQAFSHIGLINAAVALEKARSSAKA